MPRLGVWGATAMIVSEVVGVGIFLTPLTMMRTVGSPGGALIVWTAMTVLSAAGALCFAELGTRFPRNGGPYVFLREGFGERTAFIYGWMSLVVMDPGLTAALAIGFSQYLLIAVGIDATFIVPIAITTIIGFGLLTMVGVDASARVLGWSAAAKLAAVAVLVIGGLASARHAPEQIRDLAHFAPSSLAPAIVAAFFAFGGWWDLGKMAGEFDNPRRTLPAALIAGVVLVGVIYALVTLAIMLSPEWTTGSSRLLAVIVVIAVAGSLAAVLLGAPRVYVAMAGDHLLLAALARFDQRRGSAPSATAVQIILACAYVLLGTFDQILGYFVPAAVFFLGLCVLALMVLPRPTDATTFRVPGHPLPMVLFLVLIVAMLALFAVGQPRQTALGGAVVAAGIPIYSSVIRRRDLRSTPSARRA
jgi:APA family basic amino acid/polyamine antiporter